MKQLGWQERYHPTSDDTNDLFKWHKLVNAPKELTASGVFFVFRLSAYCLPSCPIPAWETMRPKLEVIYQRSRALIIQRGLDTTRELQVIMDPKSYC
jgi:hypothetical protein